MKKILILFPIILAHLSASTYYVNASTGSDANTGTESSPWKKSPYMTGFSGKYTHAASGDSFILKGTFTKDCFPMTLTDSMVSFSSDGSGLWVFDAGATKPAGGMVQSESKNDISFSGGWFTNYGTTGVAEGGKAIVISNGNRITFDSCKFTTFSWITIFLPFDKPGTYSSWTFTNNECSNTTGFVWLADAYVKGAPRSGLTLSNNWIHDFGSQIGGGIHGDGLLHSFGASPLTNSVIANNRATGNFIRSFGTDGAMTALVFCEDIFSGTISGNTLNPSPVQASMFDGFIVVHAASGQNVSILNNTITNPGASSASAGLHIFCPVGGTMNVRGNNVSGLDYAVYVEDTGGSFTSDFNVFNSTRSQLVYGPSFQTYVQWQAAGRDVHSTLGATPPIVPPVVVPPIIVPPVVVPPVVIPPSSTPPITVTVKVIIDPTSSKVLSVSAATQ